MINNSDNEHLQQEINDLRARLETERLRAERDRLRAERGSRNPTSQPEAPVTDKRVWSQNQWWTPFLVGMLFSCLLTTLVAIIRSVHFSKRRQPSDATRWFWWGLAGNACWFVFATCIGLTAALA